MDIQAEVEEAIKRERQDILEYVEQLQELHDDNKSAVIVLDFLKDLIKNRNGH